MEIVSIFFACVTFLWFIITVVAIVLFIRLVSVTQGPKDIRYDHPLNYFEKQVASRLNQLDPNTYKVLNGLLLNSNGKTAQIDHLVICGAGIFVIESKKRSGMIFGGIQSEEWTQILGKKKYPLYNPIRQNNTHVKRLKEILHDYNNLKYFPIVVFNDGLILRGDFPKNIMKIRDMIMYIKSFELGKLSEHDISMIEAKILGALQTDRASMNNHIKKISLKNEEKEHQIRKSICPKCGARLVVKQGKRGQFLGCSRFPKCTFTRRLV